MLPTIFEKNENVNSRNRNGSKRSITSAISYAKLNQRVLSARVGSSKT